MQRDMGNGPAVWLHPQLLSSVAELNLLFIDLLILQALSKATPKDRPLPAEVRPQRLKLDPSARRRAAACPYLLMDAGFDDPQRWLWAHGYAVCEVEPPWQAALSNVPQGVALARQVFAFAWHLAGAQRKLARMTLGMSAGTAEVLSNYTLVQTMTIADRYPCWLQPRWPRHVRMWRELLQGASRGEGPQLEQSRLRGVQLLASELRSSASR
jgi:hypothetical protein